MENWHPVFVHAPLTLLPLALAFQALAVARGREEWQKLALWFLWLGALGAVAAAASGLWAEEEVTVPQPGWETIERHEQLMLVSAGLAVVLAGAALWLRKRLTRGLQAGLLAGLLVLNALLLVGADLGGRLVYEFGVSVRKEALAERN
jgi:uncharacterized membrane protein